ncbi:calcium-binding protein [Haloarchaeobius amylolyticus]|uniref:Calcium-binding protein n=1 Tax=Haloarchaeobius amylolyticus TaxID=1198296 RepID=A0ABD6BI40_9EURY
MTDKDTMMADDSRRSVTKGALTTTALALGAGATAGTATAQDDDDDDDEDQVVVFEDDYRPDVDFEVISSLETAKKEDLIDDSGSADDVFDDPDDWDAYIINFDLGEDAPIWGILFTEDIDLSPGDSETMGDDGAFRDARLNMVEVGL